MSPAAVDALAAQYPAGMIVVPDRLPSGYHLAGSQSYTTGDDGAFTGVAYQFLPTGLGTSGPAVHVVVGDSAAGPGVSRAAEFIVDEVEARLVFTESRDAAIERRWADSHWMTLSQLAVG